MKKIWKWIIGVVLVVLVLLVVVALVSVPLAMHTSMMNTRVAVNNQQQAPQGWNAGPMGRGGNNGFEGRAPEGFGFNGHGNPMMGGRSGFNHSFGSFGFGLMFLGGLLRLIPVALFGLLLYGVFLLGKRSGLRAASAVVPAPAASAPSVASDLPEDSQAPQA